MQQEVAPDILRSAKETYQLELLLNGGLDAEALEKAIAGALQQHERAVVERLATEAESFAIGMESDESECGEYITALKWWAHKLRTELGPQTESGPYEPNAGDVVAVTITGAVTCWEEKCEACGVPYHKHFTWSVIDDATGDEFHFVAGGPHPARVRVLSKNEES